MKRLNRLLFSALAALASGGEAGNNYIGAWPGREMTAIGNNMYEIVVETEYDLSKSYIIVSNGSGTQTGDNVAIRNNGIYDANGDTGMSGIENVATDSQETVTYYNLQGIEIKHPTRGYYIVKKGNTVTKAYIN